MFAIQEWTRILAISLSNTVRIFPIVLEEIDKIESFLIGLCIMMG